MSKGSSDKRTIRKRAEDLSPTPEEELDRQERAGPGEPDQENPEWTEEELARAARRRRERLASGRQTAGKRRITIYLDEDLVEVFQAPGPGYQTRINEALRTHQLGLAARDPEGWPLRRIRRTLRQLEEQIGELEKRQR
jgi:uncharacterized protein (DUF4415 family)